MLVATNQEKLSSSVFRSIVRELREHPQLKVVLGDAIRPQPEWYLNGSPFIKGHVSRIYPEIFSDTMTFRLVNCREISMCPSESRVQRVCLREIKYFFHRDVTPAGSGTVYFTSIRKEKGVPFQVCESSPKGTYFNANVILPWLVIVRFRVICDDGKIVNVTDANSEENVS